MRKFRREAEPAFLTDNWEIWGREWEQRHSTVPRGQWSWRQFEGTPLNRLLLGPLERQTQEHCSFCDFFPVSPPSDDTIEHFRPKALFEREAYHWQNLYLCCRFCQTKEGLFSENILRPDAPDYSFWRYFRWDYTSGTLEINDQASEADQVKARATRDYFRLNKKHPRFRLLQQHFRSACRDKPLDDFGYRHFLDENEP